MNIPLIRLLNQQIMVPQFKTPAQVVSWMGAVQAQDATAMKWTVGLRMKSPGKSLVEQALNEGTVVRTHVMRPTWHLVTAENLRWMLMLSRESNERAYRSYLHASRMHIDETTFEKALDCMGLALEGGHSLTAKDLQDVIEQRGLPHTDRHVRAYLWLAECRALVCSGTLQGNKNTYALVDERISPQPSTTREEALTRLAHNYFRSHSPATVEDFVWWSGLKTSEARQAIGAVGQDLVTEKYRDATYYIHTTCRTH